MDLGAAENGVRDHPQDAWTQAGLRLQEQPKDPRALALRVASLYWMGHYDDMIPALQAAQAADLSPQQLGGMQVIHDMLDAERENHRIPMPLFGQMRPYLPTPRGEQPGDRQSPPPRR